MGLSSCMRAGKCDLYITQKTLRIPLHIAANDRAQIRQYNRVTRVIFDEPDTGMVHQCQSHLEERKG